MGLEYVCDDPSGDTWHFRQEDEKYVRMTKQDERSKLSGKYLVDPYVLWKNRSELHGLAGCDPNCRPCEATFKLWEHWHAYNNNKLQSV